MLTFTLASLPRRLHRYPVAWITAAVIGFAVSLGIADHTGADIPDSAWIALIVAAAALSAYFLVQLVKLFEHQLLWHLRRRLMITYIFIAVVPIILILALVALGMAMMNGQFAAFIVTVRVHDHLEELRQVNRVLAHEARRSRAASPAELTSEIRRFYVQELSAYAKSYPDLRISLHLDSRASAFDLEGKPVEDVTEIPSWTQATEEFAGIVSERGRIFLRSVDTGQTPVGRITMILSEPYSPELLNIVGAGIGPVEVVIPGREEVVPLPRAVPVLGGTGTAERSRTIHSSDITLPQAANFLDFTVSGLATVVPVRWSGNSEQPTDQPVFIHVATRISVLIGWLLDPLGHYSHIWVAVFLSVSALFLIIELISLLAGVRLTRSITGTVDQLYDATEHVRAGDLSHRINMPARDQLSSLGISFDEMTRSIERLLIESEEKTRLEQEIEIARRVQEQLFPQQLPEIPGLELYGIWRPARGVSGDYYDFLSISKTRLGIVLGDVSGKGISAALIMAGVQSVIRTRLYGATDSDEPFDDSLLSTAGFFTQLNEQMYKSTPEAQYATCFYALYDPAARELVYTNAGHPAPVLLRRNEMQRLDAGGAPLGLISSMTYSEGRLTMDPGDLLVAFTDGFSEAENSQAEEFGDHRLVAVIQQARGAPLRLVAERIYEAVDEWTGRREAQDDRTLIMVRAAG